MKHWRYKLFLLVLALAAWPLQQLIPLRDALLVAFDLAGLVFIATCINLWRNGTATRIRNEAERDDANQGLLLVLTGVISAAVLIALTALVSDPGVKAPYSAALLVGTLAISWSFANLIYSFHYARLFYGSEHGGDFGGLDFPGDDDPEFSDFVNFAFVIGMTSQTADIAITHAKFRRVATAHGLFAFVFNLGILALTINVLAGG